MHWGPNDHLKHYNFESKHIMAANFNLEPGSKIKQYPTIRPTY